MTSAMAAQFRILCVATRVWSSVMTSVPPAAPHHPQGLDTERDYPYTAAEQQCSERHRKHRVVTIDGWVADGHSVTICLGLGVPSSFLCGSFLFWCPVVTAPFVLITTLLPGVAHRAPRYEDVPENDEGSLRKAVAHQPVSVAIEADQKAFQVRD
jgi:hypothetical protein